MCVMMWMWSLFMFGVIFVFFAAYFKFVGWLCSYFEFLDIVVLVYEVLMLNVGLDLWIMCVMLMVMFKVVVLCVVIMGLMREGKFSFETFVVVFKFAFNVMLFVYLCMCVVVMLYLFFFIKVLVILLISVMV